jgi:hypothetical protein
MNTITRLFRRLGSAVLGKLTDRAHHQPLNYCNIMVLIRHLCDFDEAQVQWVLRWIAYPLRNPGAKMNMALVVNGEEGTGKSLFFVRVVVALYQPGTAYAWGANKLQSPFNGWAAAARLAVLDGRFSKINACRLKELVTAASLHVVRQGQPDQELPNLCNFIFLSTSSEFLPVIETDRRLCLLEAPPRMQRETYAAIAHEIANGGIDAFRNFLMYDLDMDNFNERTRPPATPAARAVLEVA